MKTTGSPPEHFQSVATFLREQLGIDALDVTELVPGEWSQAFAYRHGGRDFVEVRISGLEEAFRKDAWAVRFAASALPIPRVLEVGRVGDGFYAISERLWGDVLETIDGDHLRVLLPSMMATLDAMRLADLRRLGRLRWL